MTIFLESSRGTPRLVTRGFKVGALFVLLLVKSSEIQKTKKISFQGDFKFIVFIQYN